MTALAVPEGLEPLAVWDVRGERGPWVRSATPLTDRSARMIEAAQWVVRNLEHSVRIYRVDFYLFDSPFAVVHRYAADHLGRKYRDGEQPATEEPVVVPLAELPPDHLLRG